MMKYFPQVGDKLFLSQRTGDSFVDMVKTPYTVVKVTKRNVYIQECKLIFNGKRYFNTLADKIEEDKDGKIIKLNWAPSKERWQYNSEYHAGYPDYAFFGRWEYQPYLN